MNRHVILRLLALAAALCLTPACDDGGADDQTPLAADAGAPEPDPDPVVPDVSLRIAPDARACEVMFADPEGQLGEVVFGAAVQGRTLRRGDRLALAFAHRADTPIAGDAVALVARDDGADVAIESSACFDRDGRPLAAAGVELGVL